MKFRWNTEGKLNREIFWGTTAYAWGTVIDTDYTTYAIVSSCSYNVPEVLNFAVDEVHILSRSGAMDADTVTAHKTTAEAKVLSASSRWEDLEQGNCDVGEYFEYYAKIFTDPNYFFRRW